MSLAIGDVKKIAHLARLTMSDQEVTLHLPQLSTILALVEQMTQVDTSQIEPLSHPLDLSLRMRKDQVTKTDQREAYQAIAPQVEAGLYLVPKVIEGE